MQLAAADPILTSASVITTIIESRQARATQSLRHRLDLVRWLSITLSLILLLINLTIWAEYNAWFRFFAVWWVLFGGAVFYGLVYVLSRQVTTEKHMNAVSWLFVSTLVPLAFTANLVNTDPNSARPIEAALLLPAVLAGMVGLRRSGIITFGTASYLALVVSDIAVRGKLVSTVAARPTIDVITFVIWLVLFAMTCFGVIIFTERTRQSNLELENQADKLLDLLKTLNSSNEFGLALSRELVSVTTELNETSRDHAYSTQEQVAAVTEVTTSLEELNETANQIALASGAAVAAANRMLALAEQVRQAGVVAQTTATQGTTAVDQTIGSVKGVRDRIEVLGQHLLNLTEQTRQVGSIIDLIDEIASETHLLALNASIEAAGSDYDLSGSAYATVRGERFGVIAQEIKYLADRSRQSTEAVRHTIGEMQGAVTVAVLAAEEGKKETNAAFSRSEVAGEVIENLDRVVQAAARQAEAILVAVGEVKIRCEEIQLATSQQRSANRKF